MLEFLQERWPLFMLGAMLSTLALYEARGWLLTRYWSWRVARTHRHAAEILSNYRSLLRASRDLRVDLLNSLRPGYRLRRRLRDLRLLWSR